MKKSFKSVLKAGLILTTVGLLLSACAGKKQGGASSDSKTTKHNIALITDVAGVDDHSFNQSAWTGFKQYGKEHNLGRGNNGYQYFQSNGASDFVPNIERAVNANFETIFGVGYSLKDAIAQSAKKYPKKNFVIIDDWIKNQKNVVSANFKSQDASYLAGVIAAYTTKTNVVGFIGGIHGHIVDLFDAGFTKGVQDTAKKLHKNIKILNQYAGSFVSSDKGRAIAQTMYAKKADIIFHAAGKTGDGIFQAAKSINQTKPANKKVWVIGVDSDQSSLGEYVAKGGQKSNFTLTSVITGVNVAVKDIADRAYRKQFPGGKSLNYGLSNDGVAIVHNTDIPNKVWIASQKARTNILKGRIKVPIHPKNK